MFGKHCHEGVLRAGVQVVKCTDSLARWLGFATFWLSQLGQLFNPFVP